MGSISLEKLYDLYRDTLSKCGLYLLNEDNETVEYNLFEEFDIGVVSFLHEENLKKLLDAGFISSYEMENGLQLRKMVSDLQNKNEWNIKSFRVSGIWMKLLELSDKLYH